MLIFGFCCFFGGRVGGGQAGANGYLICVCVRKGIFILFYFCRILNFVYETFPQAAFLEFAYVSPHKLLFSCVCTEVYAPKTDHSPPPPLLFVCWREALTVRDIQLLSWYPFHFPQAAWWKWARLTLNPSRKLCSSVQLALGILKGSWRMKIARWDILRHEARECTSYFSLKEVALEQIEL